MMARPNRIRNWTIAACAMIASLLLGGVAARAEPLVMKFLELAAVGEIVPGATEYGQLRADIPVVEALKDGKVVGYVFLTSDFVTTTGYSGKPIHTLMGVDDTATVTGVRLVKHSEPIVLIGIPEAKNHRRHREICRPRSHRGGRSRWLGS